MKTLRRPQEQESALEQLSLFCERCVDEQPCEKIGYVVQLRDRETFYLCDTCGNVIALKGNPTIKDIEGFNKKKKRKYGKRKYGEN